MPNHIGLVLSALWGALGGQVGLVGLQVLKERVNLAEPGVQGLTCLLEIGPEELTEFTAVVQGEGDDFLVQVLELARGLEVLGPKFTRDDMAHVLLFESLEDGLHDAFLFGTFVDKLNVALCFLFEVSRS